MQNRYFLVFVLVVVSGIIWSFGAPLVRLLEDAENYRLHYLLYRGLLIPSLILILFALREGKDFFNTFSRFVSWSLVVGVLMSFHFFG